MTVEQVPTNRGRPKDAGKRKDIMDAARQLFLQHGFHGTSMDALAKEACVSKATLYSHFEDKDALYRALINDKMADYKVDDFTDMLNWDVASDLQLIAKHMLDLIFDPEALDMLRMVIAEGRTGSGGAALFKEVGPQRLLSQIAEYLERQKARGTSYIEDVEADTSLFASLVVDHRTLMFALMAVGEGFDEAGRERQARQAVARFIRLKRLETAAH